MASRSDCRAARASSARRCSIEREYTPVATVAANATPKIRQEQVAVQALLSPADDRQQRTAVRDRSQRCLGRRPVANRHRAQHRHAGELADARPRTQPDDEVAVDDVLHGAPTGSASRRTRHQTRRRSPPLRAAVAASRLRLAISTASATATSATRAGTIVSNSVRPSTASTTVRATTVTSSSTTVRPSSRSVAAVSFTPQAYVG